MGRGSPLHDATDAHDSVGCRLERFRPIFDVRARLHDYYWSRAVPASEHLPPNPFTPSLIRDESRKPYFWDPHRVSRA